MELNVANCPKCGKVYLKNIAGLCSACLKDIELQFTKCLHYLRENKGSSLLEVSEATEVSVKQITKFIREGRISIVGNPNISFPCEVCGKEIRDKHICESCRSKLVKDVSNSLQVQKREDELKRQENHQSYKINDRLEDRRK
jgi:flagellar operon protein (TIGR03826 family)